MESPSSWRCFVVPRRKNLFYYLTWWKLHEVWISNGSELLRWFDTLKLKFIKGRGYETSKGKECRRSTRKRQKRMNQSKRKKRLQFFLLLVLTTKYTHLFPMLRFTSIFSNFSNFTNQMDSMRTTLTFPTTPKEPSLITRGCCTARVTTMKNFQMILWKRFCLNLFFTRQKKMLSRTDAFMLYGKLGFTSSPLQNCYNQIWKLGYV